ncbi:unnamed protein product [Adineta ricciae]|uniref:Uncharacterized protein n=1 Tax=Adineta ricciae TaxID=249248 RepID=A0A815D714_ADIRI|nr:unnamed protein product [Adineta ricciae]CAF1293852.1 unnamed protein product [Adineta ricciae]
MLPLRLFRLAEVQSILCLISSILILILSPHFIWSWISSSFILIILYFASFLALTRWFAQGGQCAEIQTTNLNGQTFLITGAAGGIGQKTAVELAKRNARVILFARPSKLSDAINYVKKFASTPNNVTGYGLDLADLQSIRDCVRTFLANEDQKMKITALINNAGIMACPYGKTKDGFELQMGTNHFGHFYFTQLLIPRLHSARIVNVASAAHFLWRVPCDAIHYNQMCNPNTYHSFSAYSLSKTANILFTRELQRRYSSTNNIRAYSLHPGTVNTELDRHMDMNGIAKQLVRPIRYLIFKSPFEGIQTTLYCALSNDAHPGEYHSDCRVTPPYHNNIDSFVRLSVIRPRPTEELFTDLYWYLRSTYPYKYTDRLLLPVDTMNLFERAMPNLHEHSFRSITSTIKFRLSRFPTTVSRMTNRIVYQLLRRNTRRSTRAKRNSSELTTNMDSYQSTPSDNELQQLLYI